MMKNQTDLDKSAGRIGRLFDGIASSYDLTNSIMSIGIDRMWRIKAVKALDIRKGDVLLDIATGTGMLALEAFSRAECRIIGLDISSGMLTGAKRRLNEYIKGKKFLPLKADALNMPFPDNTFKKMMICFGLRNMPDIRGFLKECLRVLSPSGKISILEFSIPGNRLIRHVYLIYFRFILPFIGGVISGDRVSYRYFRDSVMGFPGPDNLSQIMRDCGFDILEKSPVFFGTAHLYLLEKSSR